MYFYCSDTVLLFSSPDSVLNFSGQQKQSNDNKAKLSPAKLELDWAWQKSRGNRTLGRIFVSDSATVQVDLRLC